MKVVKKSIIIASVAALGLSLAACKKDTTAEPQTDEASEAADAMLDASDAASDKMVAPVGASDAAKTAPAADKK